MFLNLFYIYSITDGTKKFSILSARAHSLWNNMVNAVPFVHPHPSTCGAKIRTFQFNPHVYCHNNDGAQKQQTSIAQKSVVYKTA